MLESAAPIDRIDCEQSITRCFEQQVARRGDALAIKDANGSTSYEELNQLANRIARELEVHLPGARQERVAIVLDRGARQVAALLGTLKAAHVYVPIDPAFPMPRNEHIITHSSAAIILTDTENLESATELASAGQTVINLDETDPRADTSNLATAASPDDRAYIIYTSGSTGTPKGVVQNHRNVLHGCMRRSVIQAITPQDRMTLFYSCSVMGSVYCVFGSLLNGASLFPYDVREEGIDSLGDWLAQERITIYHSVSSVFRLFAAAASVEPETLAIRLLILGGEKVMATDVDLARSVFPADTRLFTGLGSTETGTIRHFPIEPDTKIEGAVVPIGYAVEGMEILLLDERGEPVAQGDVGEIAVRSEYVALEYWNDPAATSKVLSADEDHPDVRTYRTGDMGRLGPDGLLEHRGRRDFQVKVNGYRVEIGEVEAALLQVPGVDEAVVVASELNGENRLLAYCGSNPAEPISLRPMREHMEDRLPPYMVPSLFISLETLPKTPNGKVDRAALPSPSAGNTLTEGDSLAPVTDTEKFIIGTCSELLGLPSVGTNHNFFELGGHSLLAMRLVARINKRFAVATSMRSVFDSTSLGELAAHIERASIDGRTDESPGLVHHSHPERIPASFAQQRMWLIDSMFGSTSAYNISNTVRLVGELDVSALRRALEMVIRRHAVLRTVFPSDDEGPTQEVLPTEAIKLERSDLRDLPRDDREIAALTRASDVTQGSYDLASGPLFTTELLQIEEHEHILVLVFNHIIYDNIWSSDIFFKELSTCYQHYSQYASEGTLDQPPLESLEFDFVDFALWEQRRSRRDANRDHLDYWENHLRDLPPALQVPPDRPRPTSPDFIGGQIGFEIPALVRERLSALAAQESVTTNMVLLAVWKLLLSRYTQQTDIVIGTPTGRRHRIETENMIGCFINTLVLRTDLSGNPTFNQLLSRVREVAIDAFSHDEVPFEEVVRQLHLERSATGSPLFQNFFIHREASRSRWELPGLDVRPIELHSGRSKFDLTLSVLESHHQLTGTLEYSLELFDEATAERLVANYCQLLESAVTSPGSRLSELELLTDDERSVVSDQGHATTLPAPVRSTTSLDFEEIALTFPDKTAVISGVETVTYRELNERANRLGRQLRAMGVEKDTLVAIYQERSIDLVVSLLAVHKAGGAYLPLDPMFPKQRRLFMLEDSGAELVVSTEKAVTELGDHSARVLLLDRDREAVDAHASDNLEPTSGLQDLAYVIYTSGSTGKPKGVQIEHAALANFLASMRVRPGLKPSDVVHAVTTISFDISVLELFLPLVIGATVVVEPQALAMDPEALTRSMDLHSASVMQATPSTWRMLLESGWTGRPGLKILCGGEAMGTSLAEQLLDVSSDVWNMYGPTETTIWSSVKRVECAGDAAEIGDPIANTELYVLGPDNTLQPIGVPGELLIGGDGLARGYRDRPELTAEKFVPHPLLSTGRLYRTGDLVVRRPDGAIRFLGRMDTQVKLHGFRIELGDIESALTTHSEIRNSVVELREDTPGDKRLVAYVLLESGSADPDSSEEPSATAMSQELRRHLHDRLPHYMIPAFFVALDALPMTANGKVDRKKLPAPNHGITTADEPIDDENPLAVALLQIFSDVLQVPVSSTYSSFFDLGGHSLLALRAIASINDQLSTNLPPLSIFGNPSVHQLLELIADEHQNHESGSPADHFDVVFPISTAGSGPPLFLVSGAHQTDYVETGAGSYEEEVYRYFGMLLGALGTGRPVYAFRPRGVMQGETYHRSVQEMASEYVQHIRGTQPDGPYNIGGECVGGLVAYEIAQQLLAAGCEVSSLILLDTHFPSTRRALRDKARFHHRLARARYRAIVTCGRERDLVGVFRHLRDGIGELSTYVLPIGSTRRQRRNARFGGLVYLGVLAKYSPDPIDTPISLIVNERSQSKTPGFGWDEGDHGDMTIYTVPGTHKTRLTEFAKELGQAINGILDQRSGVSDGSRPDELPTVTLG